MAGLPVLVPVNALDRAKGRLAGALDRETRARLALATLTTVVEAARTAGLTVTVLTADERAAGAVRGAAAWLPEDEKVSGLNRQLDSALGRMAAVGDLAEVLILHADLPLANAGALERLVAAAAPAPSATMVASGDGGTNALLLRPPGWFALAYGPGSCERHRAAAVAAGMAVALVDEPALALDLDTPDDIKLLLASPEGRASRAGLVLGEALRRR